MNGTSRQSRARRPSSGTGSSDGQPDLAARLRPLQAQLRRRLAHADALADMFRAVNANLDPARVADAMMTRAADWLPAPGWLVAARIGATATRAIATRALTPDLERAALRVADCILRTGNLLFSSDISADGRLTPREGEVPAAALGFPLDCRGRTVGALVAIDRAPASREPRLAPATLAAVRGALEPGAIALDNALRMQRAESLSVTDDLTQLYNSRYLSQALRRETKRSARSARPLSLLFVDLDGFKAVNDTHGHLLGSSALVEAAAVIRASARETDIVARFGGDEFALVLPDTGTDGAVAVAERVRDRIASHRFLRGEGLDVGLTVSVGVATLRVAAPSAEGLLRDADDAMYRIKAQGKNGVHVAGS